MKKAFTLIELLVVIAIIAILAALLMPALSRAREEAQKTKCKSNVHNVGIAFQLFLNDHDQLYPGWVDDDIKSELTGNSYWTSTAPEKARYAGPTNGGPYYQLMTQTYAEDIDLFDCPTADNPSWGEWGGPELVGTDGSDGQKAQRMGQPKCVEFPEYAYDIGRVSRNSVAGRIFYGDCWERKHMWGSNWGYWPYNHEGGSNAVMIDQAVQWCGLQDPLASWSMVTNNGNWARTGYIPNPRMDEDVQRFDTYVRNGIGIWWNGPVPTSETQLLYPAEHDDIYAIEGWSGWGGVDCTDMFAMAGDPTIPGGGTDSLGCSGITPEPNEYGIARDYKFWEQWGSAWEPGHKRFYPEAGPFANEGRWDTHDARLVPINWVVPGQW